MDATASPTLGAPTGNEAVDSLLALAYHGQSGVLKVGTTSPTWVAVADGRIVVAGSANSLGIAHALHAAGVVDDEALRRSGGHGGSHDLSVLEELVEHYPAASLAPVVHAQAVHAVFQMLLPPPETSAFMSSSPISLAEHFSFPVDSIVAEAQARVAQWAQIAESIPSTQAVFRPRRQLAPEMDTVSMSREQWAVMSVLDGRRSVAQAISAAGRSAYDVCIALHELTQAGLIERSS